MSPLTLTWLVAAFLQPAPPSRSIALSLRQEFGRAVYTSCQLDIVISDGSGGASSRCVRNATPPSHVGGERKLTAEQTKQLLAVARDSDLWGGGHVGVDSTAADGLFETLKVNGSQGTVVLVTSGNPTFMSGRRRQLLQMLHTILDQLRSQAE
jgi:hypothetical protein